MSHDPDNNAADKLEQLANDVEQKTAAYHLRAYQRQLDEDGIEVGVSREALEEVLRIVDQQAAIIEGSRVPAWQIERDQLSAELAAANAECERMRAKYSSLYNLAADFWDDLGRDPRDLPGLVGDREQPKC